MTNKSLLPSVSRARLKRPRAYLNGYVSGESLSLFIGPKRGLVAGPGTAELPCH